MSDREKRFIIGANGILRENPKANRWNSNYSEPDKAVEFPVYEGGRVTGYRLGCTHRRFENYSSFACKNPAKHDLDADGNPTKCGVHSEDAKKKRKDKQEAKDKAARDYREIQNAPHAIMREAEELIGTIAAGHNDPRAVCADFLERLGDARAKAKSAREAR